MNKLEFSGVQVKNGSGKKFCILGLLLLVFMISFQNGILVRIFFSDGPTSETVSDLNSELTRGEITQFKDGTITKEVYFMEGGTNNTVKLILPSNIEITSASMTIDGLPLTSMVDREYSYNDTINNSAWWGGIHSLPDSPPGTYENNSYNLPQLILLQNRDNLRANTGNIDDQYAYQMFHFSNISTNNIWTMRTNWEGGGMGNPDMGFGTNGVKWLIYDHSSGLWELVDEFHTGEVPDEKALSRTYLCNQANILDNSGNMYYLAVTRVGGNGFTTYMKTDFTNAVATYNIDSYTENCSLNLDMEGNVEWNHQGVFDTTVNVNDTYSFRETLQSLVDNSSGDSVNITLSLSSDKPGIMGLRELSIQYDIVIENQRPELTGSFYSQNFNFPEDSHEGIGLIDLEDYFQDDDDFNNITFTVTMNHTRISAFINTSTNSIDFVSNKNYFGKERFRIKAEDNEGLYIETDPFWVSVTPTNDAPSFSFFNGIEIRPEDNEIKIEAMEGKINSYPFLTEDVDGDVPLLTLNDHYQYSDILYLLSDNNNSLVGSLAVEPEDQNIGSVIFNISINDVNGSAQNSMMRLYTINISVSNTNDAPVIIEMEGMDVLEDQWLNFTLDADDIDTDCDISERLIYHTNFSQWNIGSDKWSLDGQTGNFSFKPDNDDVGLYTVNFSVEDQYDGKDWFNTTIEVLNVNDPPTAGEIIVTIEDALSNTTEKENLTISFSTEEGQDPDLIHGDTLTYSWDFDAKDGIDKEAVGRQVNHTYAEGGTYGVTLIVIDSNGMSNLSSGNIVVIAPILPDDNDNDDTGIDNSPDDETGGSGFGKKGLSAGIWLLIIFSIIILIAVLVIIGFIAKVRKRASEEEIIPAEGGENKDGEELDRFPNYEPQEYDPYSTQNNPESNIRQNEAYYPYYDQNMINKDISPSVSEQSLAPPHPLQSAPKYITHQNHKYENLQEKPYYPPPPPI